MLVEEEILNNPIIPHHPQPPGGSLLCVMLFYIPTWIISYMSSERNSTHPIEFLGPTREEIEATPDAGEI
jgi:hypothetical protein